MEFEVRLKRKELSEFMINRVYRSSNGKMSILAGIIIIVLAGVIYFQNESPVLYPVILFACGAISPLGPAIQVIMMTRRGIDESVPDQYVMREKEIRYSHNGHSMTIGWNRILCVQEYPEGIVMDLPGKRILMIPRKAVPDLYERIVQEIKAHKEIIKNDSRKII